MTLYTGEAVLGGNHGLYAKGECVNGIKVGRWHYYGSGVNVISHITYDENGRKTGEAKAYYDTGELRKIEFYKKGVVIDDIKTFYRDGTLKSLYKHSKNGSSISYIGYYPNGRKRLYQEFDDDKSNLLKLEIWYKEDGTLWQYSRHVKGKCVYKKAY